MSHWVGRVNSLIDMEVLEESALAMAQATIQNAINDARISRADLARSMQCNRSVVSRILSGHHNLTIKTMARALAACGSDVRFQRVPIEWSWGCKECNPPRPLFVPAFARQAGSMRRALCAAFQIPERLLGNARQAGKQRLDSSFVIVLAAAMRELLEASTMYTIHTPEDVAEMAIALGLLNQQPAPLTTPAKAKQRRDKYGRKPCKIILS